MLARQCRDTLSLDRPARHRRVDRAQRHLRDVRTGDRLRQDHSPAGKGRSGQDHISVICGFSDEDILIDEAFDESAQFVLKVQSHHYYFG